MASVALPVVTLLPGRERSLLRRHPWVFSGAVAGVQGRPEPGALVALRGSDGAFLGYASWSPASQLRARVWSFEETEFPDRDFFRRRLQAAAAFRRELGLDDPAGGCRLVYSEADGLPGLIVDRYGSCAAVQYLSCGAEYFRETIGGLLLELPGIRSVYDRSDAPVRRKEGLTLRNELQGGEPVPEELTVTEEGLSYLASVPHGQKTGFYFDLRTVRRRLRELSRGRRVLNVFAYTGGFACSALAGGAVSVLNVDSSRPALETAAANLRLNGFAGNWENRCGDAFAVMRELNDAGEKFDLVILDPPKLIDRKEALTAGCRGYQALARLGFSLLNPGGLLANFSCSGLMLPELFWKITAAAAQEAGRTGRILENFTQAPDHPVALTVPETFYLKGLLSRVD